MQIDDMWSLLETSPQEGRFAIMADLAVLCSEPEYKDLPVAERAQDYLVEVSSELADGIDIDVFIRSLHSDSLADGRWRDELAKAATRVSVARRHMLLADLCLDSALIEEVRWSSGRLLRRLDAVLDVVGIDFAAADVWSTFDEYDLGLADNKLTWMHVGGAVAAAGMLGFAGGFLGQPWVGKAAGSGADRVLGRLADSDATSQACARLLIAAFAATTGDMPESEDLILLREALRVDAVDTARSVVWQLERGCNPIDAERRGRILTAALGIVTSLVKELGLPNTTVCPDVSKLSLSSAERLLGALGYEVDVTTNCGRMVINKENWRVGKQFPAPRFEGHAGRIKLTVDKLAA